MEFNHADDDETAEASVEPPSQAAFLSEVKERAEVLSKNVRASPEDVPAAEDAEGRDDEMAQYLAIIRATETLAKNPSLMGCTEEGVSPQTVAIDFSCIPDVPITLTFEAERFKASLAQRTLQRRRRPQTKTWVSDEQAWFPKLPEGVSSDEEEGETRPESPPVVEKTPSPATKKSPMRPMGMPGGLMSDLGNMFKKKGSSKSKEPDAAKVKSPKHKAAESSPQKKTPKAPARPPKATTKKNEMNGGTSPKTTTKKQPLLPPIPKARAQKTTSTPQLVDSTAIMQSTLLNKRDDDKATTPSQEPPAWIKELEAKKKPPTPSKSPLETENPEKPGWLQQLKNRKQDDDPTGKEKAAHVEHAKSPPSLPEKITGDVDMVTQSPDKREAQSSLHDELEIKKVKLVNITNEERRKSPSVSKKPKKGAQCPAPSVGHMVDFSAESDCPNVTMSVDIEEDMPVRHGNDTQVGSTDVASVLMEFDPLDDKSAHASETTADLCPEWTGNERARGPCAGDKDGCNNVLEDMDFSVQTGAEADKAKVDLFNSNSQGINLDEYFAQSDEADVVTLVTKETAVSDADSVGGDTDPKGAVDETFLVTAKLLDDHSERDRFTAVSSSLEPQDDDLLADYVCVSAESKLDVNDNDSLLDSCPSTPVHRKEILDLGPMVDESPLQAERVNVAHCSFTMLPSPSEISKPFPPKNEVPEKGNTDFLSQDTFISSIHSDNQEPDQQHKDSLIEQLSGNDYPQEQHSQMEHENKPDNITFQEGVPESSLFEAKMDKEESDDHHVLLQLGQDGQEQTNDGEGQSRDRQEQSKVGEWRSKDGEGQSRDWGQFYEREVVQKHEQGAEAHPVMGSVTQPVMEQQLDTKETSELPGHGEKQPQTIDAESDVVATKETAREASHYEKPHFAPVEPSTNVTHEIITQVRHLSTDDKAPAASSLPLHGVRTRSWSVDDDTEDVRQQETNSKGSPNGEDSSPFKLVRRLEEKLTEPGKGSGKLIRVNSMEAAPVSRPRVVTKRYSMNENLLLSNNSQVASEECLSPMDDDLWSSATNMFESTATTTRDNDKEQQGLSPLHSSSSSSLTDNEFKRLVSIETTTLQKPTVVEAASESPKRIIASRGEQEDSAPVSLKLQPGSRTSGEAGPPPPPRPKPPVKPRVRKVPTESDEVKDRHSDILSLLTSAGSSSTTMPSRRESVTAMDKEIPNMIRSARAYQAKQAATKTQRKTQTLQAGDHRRMGRPNVAPKPQVKPKPGVAPPVNTEVKKPWSDTQEVDCQMKARSLPPQSSLSTAAPFAPEEPVLHEIDIKLAEAKRERLLSEEARQVPLFMQEFTKKNRSHSAPESPKSNAVVPKEPAWLLRRRQIVDEVTSDESGV